MDLNSIEATSVAIRVGQRAAAELCSLLTQEDEDVLRPIEDWFDPQPAVAGPPAALQAWLEALTGTLDKLGGYVCHSPDPVSGERLFRWAVQEGLARRTEWRDLPFGRHHAFEVFAQITRAVYAPLKAEQQRLVAEGADPPRQLGLALEDSIFEPDGEFGDLVPGAEQMLASMATATFERPPAPPAAEEPAKPPTLSIGESPPKPRGNQGGRGNRRNP